MDIKLLAFFLTILFVTGIGFALGFFLKSWQVGRGKWYLEEQLSRMRRDANDEVSTIKENARREASLVREESLTRQQMLDEREEGIIERQKRIDRHEVRHEEEREQIQSKHDQLEELQAKARATLEQQAELSAKEARHLLLEETMREEEDALERRRHLLLDEREGDLAQEARELLTVAVQRYANAVDNEVVSTHIDLGDDELKGKIIGKEGRNIKAFERASGVQLVIDETPGALTISSFDPIRRMVAKMALEVLIADGRIQPARIEQAIQQAQKKLDASITEHGRRAVRECDVRGLDEELVRIVGRLHFRYSYGQNVLQHSVEMAHIANVLATQLGADKRVARAGALLHDIGKAVDHEVEGTHVEIGRRILKTYGVEEEIIKAMQAHHEEYPYETIESRIVQAADAISSTRPGARSDNADAFVQKMTNLERIALAHEGISEAYALQAGREIRVFVEPQKVNDFQAGRLAHRIAKEIEQELKYPGEIKVVVIRENRTTEYAR